MYKITRYHDISAGHRVSGHESKCKHLHGHNYRIHFTVQAIGGLDELGRVIDFSVIKERLCEWVELFWDHKMLIWEQDPMREKIYAADPDGVVIVSFNPTAENMAQHLVEVVGPNQLFNRGVILSSVTIDETRKCSATYDQD